MTKVKLTRLDDILAETIEEISISSDGKYWVIMGSDHNPVKLELPEHMIIVDNEQSVVIEDPVRMLDMSLVVRYDKLPNGKLNIAEVALNGPKASDANFKGVVIENKEGV